MKVETENPAALNDRGSALLGLNRFEEALASFDQALAIQPHYAQALNNLGTIARALGDYPQALSYMSESLAIYRDQNDFSGSFSISISSGVEIRVSTPLRCGNRPKRSMIS